MSEKSDAKVKNPEDSGIGSSKNSNKANVNEEEDWDNMVSQVRCLYYIFNNRLSSQAPVPTYNAMKKCRESDVILHVQHGIPSERKKKREQEHERLNIIRGVNNCSGSTSFGLGNNI
jgi:hypothetical protein